MQHWPGQGDRSSPASACCVAVHLALVAVFLRLFPSSSSSIELLPLPLGPDHHQPPSVRLDDIGHGGWRFNRYKDDSLSEREKVQLDFSSWRDDVPCPSLFLFLFVTYLWRCQNILRSGQPSSRASSIWPHPPPPGMGLVHTRTCVHVIQSHSAIRSLDGLAPPSPIPRSGVFGEDIWRPRPSLAEDRVRVWPSG